MKTKQELQEEIKSLEEKLEMIPDFRGEIQDLAEFYFSGMKNVKTNFSTFDNEIRVNITPNGAWTDIFSLTYKVESNEVEISQSSGGWEKETDGEEAIQRMLEYLSKAQSFIKFLKERRTIFLDKLLKEKLKDKQYREINELKHEIAKIEYNEELSKSMQQATPEKVLDVLQKEYEIELLKPYVSSYGNFEKETHLYIAKKQADKNFYSLGGARISKKDLINFVKNNTLFIAE